MGGDRLYSVIFEVKEDKDGEYYWLVTLWKATREEEKLYEESTHKSAAAGSGVDRADG